MKTWQGCYNDSWNGLIVPEAFSHPAKFAPGLIRRILKHGLEHGYWERGQVIGDPFGGIGGGGIMAAPMGLQWIGVELEEKFVTLAQENFKLHYRDFYELDFPFPVILQGDSRNFASIVGGCDAICTSPPFVDMGMNIVKEGHNRQVVSGGKLGHGTQKGELTGKTSYGTNPSNIGNLKAGELDAIITSPPYADSVKSQDHGIDWTKAGPATGNRNRGAGTKHEETFRGQLNYSMDPQNIGNLKAGTVDGVVTSPPFCDAGAGDKRRYGGIKDPSKLHSATYYLGGITDYGQTPGQIARLKEGNIDGIVTSPPWENQIPSQEGPEFHQQRESIGKNNSLGHGDYGTFPGQIGKDSGETYWEAMAQVYTECHKALKPGGVIAVVIKDYVKNKKRVPLCDQTWGLLLKLGFHPLERIRAMLVEEHPQKGLFGQAHKVKERKSFFRRLAEKKGSPRIDWEEVLWLRKKENV